MGSFRQHRFLIENSRKKKRRGRLLVNDIAV